MYTPDVLVSFIVFILICLVVICAIACVVNTKWFRRIIENATRRFTENHHIK